MSTKMSKVTQEMANDHKETQNYCRLKQNNQKEKKNDRSLYVSLGPYTM